MGEQTETESFFKALIRSESITLGSYERVVNLVEMGKNNGVNVKYDDIGDKYRERYEVYVDKDLSSLYFDRLRYEKDTISYNVKLDPRNEVLARALLRRKSIDATDVETLLKDALFSYAYQELGKDQVDELLGAVNAEYTEEYR